MNIIKFLLFFLLVPLAQAEDWKLVKDKKDIAIYSLQKTNYQLKHYKVKAIINKDADTILAALQDTQACYEWVYNCISNDMVEMIDYRKRIYHTIIGSPLWFKNRDFYLQSSVIYDANEKTFQIKFESMPEYKKQLKNTYRIKQVEMIWELKKLTEAKTEVIYQVYVDPKLPIKSINHLMIKKSIYQTMLGLKRIVNKPIYAQTKYSKSELEMLTKPS